MRTSVLHDLPSMTVTGVTAWQGVRRAIGVLLIWLVSHATAWAVEPVTLRGCDRLELDGRQLEAARLPTGGDGLEQALAAPFQPLQRGAANFGLVGGSVWLRLTIAAGGCDGPLLLQLGNPFANRVTVFREQPRGRWSPVSASDLASAAGDERIRYAMLPLERDAGRATRFLVRVGGPSAVLIRPAIASANGLHLHGLQRNLIGGMLAGGVVALAIYCALLGTITRFRGLIAFSVSGLALAGFYGVTVGLLDPFVLWIAGARHEAHDVVLWLDGMFVLTAGLFHWFFVRGLLGGAASPGDGGLRTKLALGAWAVTMVTVPFVEGPAMPAVCIAAALAAMAASLFELTGAVRRRHPIAQLLVIAFGVLSLSVIGFIGLYVGLLPWHPVFLHSIAVGTWVEALLLSVAVGTHVKDLRGQQQQLAARTHELNLLSQIDALTGLGNRRAYDAGVPQELERCERRGSTASLLVIDIDHFKQVNDTFGHGFGDSVIRMLGVTVANSVRSSDLAFRYGGEEFVVLLPGLASAMALEVAERIMREFTNCSPSAPDGSRPFVSVSIGIAQMRAGDDTLALFGRADSAMYRAKQEGRCRTVVADESPSGARIAEHLPA